MATVVVAVALSSACAGTEQPGRPGEVYTFVAPGGETFIEYPVAARQALPDVRGQVLGDAAQSVGSRDVAGTVVVVNVWASWCAPCREEMPDLQYVQATTDAAVLGVNIRDNEEFAQDLVENLGVTYPSIHDYSARSLAVLRGYPRNVLPLTVVLDTSHRVAAVYLRQVRASELVRLVTRLQNESR